MEDHGYHSMGKYSSARDDLLHYLCITDWAEESTGNTESPSGYVWRISNEAADVQQANGEFNSVVADWFANTAVIDSPELRAELVGHFIVQTVDSGFVYVYKYDSAEEQRAAYDELENQYAEWDDEELGTDESDEDFYNYP